MTFAQELINHPPLELTESWHYRWGESPLYEGGIPLWIVYEDTMDTNEWKSVEYNNGILNPSYFTQSKTER